MVCPGHAEATRCPIFLLSQNSFFYKRQVFVSLKGLSFTFYLCLHLIMPHDYGLGAGFEPKHVDRKSLYTSLEERIKYLHHFLDFNAGMY
jgi:hypothetical protein